MKRIYKVKRKLASILVIYMVFTVAIFGVFGRNREQGVYALNVSLQDVTEKIDNIEKYCQRFYTPYTCSGMQLCVATDRTEAQRDLVIRIYSVDDELIGEHIINHKKIKDNEYIDLIFEDYVLAEGEQYYFTVCSVGVGENPLRLWMGQTNSEFCLEAECQGEVLADTIIAFNLIYEYTNKGFVMWMFLSVIFLFVILKRANVLLG